MFPSPTDGFSLDHFPSAKPIALISGWQPPTHPVRSREKVKKEAIALCIALESAPIVTLRPQTTENTSTTFDSAPENEEELRIVFEMSEAILTQLDGTNFQRLLRFTRTYLFNTPLAARLEAARQLAKQRFSNLKDSLLFALDEPVGTEWLPTPAPPGSLTNIDTISAEELFSK